MDNKLIVILGPTASGKTDLSIKLAKKFNAKKEELTKKIMREYKYEEKGKQEALTSGMKEFFKGEKYQSSINYSKPLSQEVLDAHKGYIYFAKQNEIISYHPSTNSFNNVFKTISGDVSVIQHWGDTMFCADKQFF